MKMVSISASIFAATLLAACGASNTSGTLNSNSATNDLPRPILRCFETKDDVEVLDGRAELTVSKDQFGIFYVKVVQRDQFSGDSVLADVGRVARSTTGSTTRFQTKTPTQTLSLTIANSLKAHLTLVTTGRPSRDIDFACEGSLGKLYF